MPALRHSDIEKVDFEELGKFIAEYGRVNGFALSESENYVRQLVGFPERQGQTP